MFTICDKEIREKASASQYRKFQALMEILSIYFEQKLCSKKISEQKLRQDFEQKLCSKKLIGQNFCPKKTSNRSWQWNIDDYFLKQFDIVNNILKDILFTSKLDLPSGLLCELKIRAVQQAYDMCREFTAKQYDYISKNVFQSGIYAGPYMLVSPASKSPYALLRYWIELYAERSLDNEIQDNSSTSGEWYVLHCLGYKLSENGIILTLGDAFATVCSTPIDMTEKAAQSLTGRFIRVLAKATNDRLKVIQIITTPVYYDLKTVPGDNEADTKSFIFEETGKTIPAPSYEEELYLICFLIRLMNLYDRRSEKLLTIAPYYNNAYGAWMAKDNIAKDKLEKLQTYLGSYATARTMNCRDKDYCCYIGFSDLWKRVDFQGGPACIGYIDAVSESNGSAEEHYTYIDADGNGKLPEPKSDLLYKVRQSDFFFGDRTSDENTVKKGPYILQYEHSYYNSGYMKTRKVENYGDTSPNAVILPKLGSKFYEPLICLDNSNIVRQTTRAINCLHSARRKFHLQA